MFVYHLLGFVMEKIDLSRLCMDEADPMLKAVVQCKHGNLLQMHTSWSKSNPGRRYWSCPYYGPKKCKFFRWRDKDEVDPRSKVILPILVNKIRDLEKELVQYNGLKMELDEVKIIDNNSVSVDMNLLELDGPKEDIRKNKGCRFNRNVILCFVVCVVVFISSLFHIGNSNIELIKLP
ncbi:uncharacterized protein LOC132045662 [Lycium ferocissimum]|uniref:uncharacterized protein LOC132045662 n=1 Tax=Lycium ferocissimum TaxID=112874 RepID=UPI0028154F09|nr:uncharacterized protein LOC132045662 [Lycium ferocissimum]